MLDPSWNHRGSHAASQDHFQWRESVCRVDSQWNAVTSIKRNQQRLGEGRSVRPGDTGLLPREGDDPHHQDGGERVQ